MFDKLWQKEASALKAAAHVVHGWIHPNSTKPAASEAPPGELSHPVQNEPPPATPPNPDAGSKPGSLSRFA